MSQNRDIRSFFSKGPKQQLSSQAGPSSSQPSIGDLPSSPVTPPRAAKAPHSKDDEIKGSDDDDSDCSLESLSAIYGTRRNANAMTTTPKAKRIASGFHKSPLTLQQQKPQKHKYDIKSLISHAREDEARDEIARKADELLKMDIGKAESDSDSDNDEDMDKVKETAKALLLQGDDEDHKGTKLERAIKRTQADELRKRCYFFNPEVSPSNLPRQAFPKKTAVGMWKFLRDESQRKQMFIGGLPITVATKGHKVRDDIFEWLLSEICREEIFQVRIQYCNFVALCHDQIHRLVTTARLYSMLEHLGGPKWSPTMASEFKQSPGLQDPYPDRNWSFLEYFLKLLVRMAPYMAEDNVVGAIQILLRMSLDPIVTRHISIRRQHSEAMNALITALPAPEAKWNSSCATLCSYMDKGVQDPSQRVKAVKLLPRSNPRARELSRRLATAALFQDPDLGGRHPDDTVTFDDIFDRIAEPDFQIKPSTDYIELQALVGFLDSVLGNCQHLYYRIASSGDEADVDQDFDAEIDKLTSELKVMHDLINANSLVDRKEAKADIDSLSKRLAYIVRTKPPAKKNIFDGIREEDVSLPKQRDFMKKWALKKAENDEPSNA